MALLCVLAGSSEAAAGDTTRVSLADSSGTQAIGGGSSNPSISSDGRYVVFMSAATNLVEGDTNAQTDVFLRDRQTGTTKLVSVSSSETQANTISYNGSISSDGRYVVFASAATNLVVDDTNNKQDIFVRDLRDGTTARVSVDSSGNQANESSCIFCLPRPIISSNGRYVAFTSSASNLVANDTIAQDVFVHDRDADADFIMDERGEDNAGAIRTERVSGGNGGGWGPSMSSDGRYVAFYSATSNRVVDVFVRDRQTGTTQQVGVNSCGTQANGNIPTNFSISSDGRFLAFHSTATNLVEGDTNNFSDAFVRHLKPNPDQLVKIERVSVSNSGTQAIGSGSNSPSISADGRYVAFGSGATNLVEGDTNGQSDIFVHERGDTVPTEEISDCIAPTTTANATTTDSGATYTSDTWTNESLVEVTFSAQDNEGGSGVKEIRYSASGAQSIPQTVYDEQNPPVIDTEGTTTISYFAIDNAGNRESPAKTFTVKLDRSTPTLGTVSPADLATGVPLTANVEATFLEDMNPGCITDQTFTLTKQGSSSPVAAAVSYVPTTKQATLDPSSDLEANTSYAATLKGGSTGVKDPAGNALAQDHSWTFTTAPPDTTAPKVSTATPTGTGVARGTDATATFSEKMAPASITTSTFKLFKCSSTTSTNCATQITNVAVSLSTTDALKATLNPYGTSSTLLASKTKYKAVVTTGAKDVAGNALDQDPSAVGNQQKVWYFTTGRT